MNELMGVVEQLRDEMVAFAFDHNSEKMFDVATDLTCWLEGHGWNGYVECFDCGGDDVVNQIIDGFKVTADLVKVNSSFGEDIMPKLLEIRDSTGNVVVNWITDFSKISMDTFENIMDHLMG